jgi:hypothetical protein
MSDEAASAQTPNPEDKELTPEQLADVAGGKADDTQIPIDVNEINESGNPPPGSQTPGQDTPDRLGVSIHF